MAQHIFISPMGEPYRARSGEDPVDLWFAAVDTNGDGRLDRDEMLADADRFFARLDTDSNGMIEPEEVKLYEDGILNAATGGPRHDEGAAGETSPRSAGGGGRHGGGMGRHMGGGGRGMGGGMGGAGMGGSAQVMEGARAFGSRPFAALGFFDNPQPVTSADSDMNRSITRAEFRSAAMRRFDQLDSNHDGVIPRDELPLRAGEKRDAGTRAPDTRLDSGRQRPQSMLP